MKADGDLDEKLFDVLQSDGVQSGPFTGMRIARDPVWKDGTLGAKLIGSCEFELHPSHQCPRRDLGWFRRPRPAGRVPHVEPELEMGFGFLAHSSSKLRSGSKPGGSRGRLVGIG